MSVAEWVRREEGGRRGGSGSLISPLAGQSLDC